MVVCLVFALAVLVGCAKHEAPTASASTAAAPTAVAGGEGQASLRLRERNEPAFDLASVPRVSVEDLKAAMDAGSVTVLDVRNDSAWESSHIPGAIHVPGGEIPSRLGEIPRGKMVVAYCT